MISSTFIRLLYVWLRDRLSLHVIENVFLFLSSYFFTQSILVSAIIEETRWKPEGFQTCNRLCEPRGLVGWNTFIDEWLHVWRFKSFGHFRKRCVCLWPGINRWLGNVDQSPRSLVSLVFTYWQKCHLGSPKCRPSQLKYQVDQYQQRKQHTASGRPPEINKQTTSRDRWGNVNNKQRRTVNNWCAVVTSRLGWLQWVSSCEQLSVGDEILAKKFSSTF